MMRKLALSLAVAAAMSSSQALALGLGEIRVNSALNEPLNAEIQLLQVRDLSPLQIRPRMADVDEFSLAGLSKSRFLNDVKFQVNVDPNGKSSISVSSSVPVLEPFLSFLMEVNWPNGRLVREYTLLLDPPVFDPAPTAKIVTTPATPARQATAPSTKPAMVAPAAPVANAHTVRTDMNPVTEVYVDINDTLYVIAKKNRPANDISVEQMMIALQRKNPQAFPTANINMMKAGTVMKLPTAEEARALTRKQAIAEAARQTADWKAGRRKAVAPPPSSPVSEEKDAGAPTEGKPTSGTAEASAETGQSQLKILTATDQQPQAADTSAASESAVDAVPEDAGAAQETGPTPREQELIDKNAELENRLLMTQETVTKIERENADLGGKFDSIQEQLISLQRLIELKDQQMATLQAEMLKQAQEADKPKPSLIDDLINTLMQNPMYIAGAGGVLVLLLALLAFKRRKKNAYQEPVPRKSKKSKSKVAEPEQTEDAIPAFDERASDMPAAAVVGAAAAGVAAASMVDSAEADDELDDELSDLDLDMDLDLDEIPEEEVDDSPLDDLEISQEASEAEAEIDSMLDDILDETQSEAGAEISATAERDELDDLLDSQLDSDLDDLSVSDADLTDEVASLEGLAEQEAEDESSEDDELEFAVAPMTEEEAPVTEDESDDDLEGLEFAVDVGEDQELPVNSDEEGFIDDSFFDAEVPEETGTVAPTPEVEPDELIDEALESDARPAQADFVSSNQDDELDDLLDDDLDKMLADSAAALAEEEAETDQPAEASSEGMPADEDLDLGDFDFNIDDEDHAAELESPVAEIEPEAAGELEPISEADIETDTESAETGLDDILAEVDEVDQLPALDDGEADEEFDIDSLLAAPDAQPEIEPEQTAQSNETRAKTPGELVEDELTANIAHDLDLTLDDELDEILDSTDSEVELVEEGDSDLSSLEEESGLEVLDGADEVETKLDLARAYIEMDDADGARDILNEVKRDGSQAQQVEAQNLLDKLS